MAIKTDIILDVDSSKGQQGTVGLRKEIKNLRLELDKLDEGTVEYQQTFDKLSAKMKIQDDRMKALMKSSGDLGDALGNISSIGGSLTSGFVGIQGAMQLFGSESEDLLKVLTKLQGGMALAQGFVGLENLTKSIPALISNLKGLFGISAEGAQSIKQVTESVKDTSDSTAIWGAQAVEASTDISMMATNTQNAVNTQETLSKLMNDNQSVYEASILKTKTLTSEFETLAEKNKELNESITKYREEGNEVLVSSLEHEKKLNRDRMSLIRDELDMESTYRESLEEGVNVLNKKNDALEKTDKSAVKAAGGIGKLTKSILTSLGIMALITAAITGIIYLYENWDKIFNNIDENQKLVNDTMLKGSQSAVDQTLKLKLLRDEFNKLDSIKEKTKFLNNYKDELKNVGIEVTSVTELEAIFSSDTNTQKYVNALVEKAKAQAAFSEMVTLSGEIQQLEFEREEILQKKSIDGWKAYWISFKSYASGKGVLDMADIVRKEVRNIDKEIREAQLKIGALKSNIDVNEILKINEPKEIVNTVKKTLSDYLSELTEKNKQLTKVNRDFYTSNKNALDEWLSNQQKAYDMGIISEVDFIERKKQYNDKLNELDILQIDYEYKNQVKALEDKKDLDDKATQAALDKINKDYKNEKDKQKLIDEVKKEQLVNDENFEITKSNIQDQYVAKRNAKETEGNKQSLTDLIEINNKKLAEFDRFYNKLEIIQNVAMNELIKEQLIKQNEEGFFANYLGIGNIQKELDKFDLTIEQGKNKIKQLQSKYKEVLKQLAQSPTDSPEYEAKLNEKLKLEQEISDQSVAIAQNEADKKKVIYDNIQDNINNGLQATSASFQSIVDLIDASYEKQTNDAKESYDNDINNYNNLLNSKKITQEQYDNFVQNRDKEYSAKSLKIQQEQNEKSKKWMAGLAIIDGLKGASSVWANAGSFGPLGFILAGIQSAAILATTYANVKKIYSQKVSDSGTTGGGSGISPNAVANVVSPLNYSTNLTTQSQQEELNKPQKVYVLESEIKDVGNRVKITENESTF